MSDTVRTQYVYNRRTNYMYSNDVYVYPSSQSDDGGDVNTEQNIKSIGNDLIHKSFIINKDKVYSNLNKVWNPLSFVRPDEDGLPTYWYDMSKYPSSLSFQPSSVELRYDLSALKITLINGNEEPFEVVISDKNDVDTRAYWIPLSITPSIVEPLSVDKSSNQGYIHLNEGRAVVEGYLVDIKSGIDLSVKDSLIQDDFNFYSSSEYANMLAWYQILSQSTSAGSYLASYTPEELNNYIKDNALYLVIELLTDVTGNVRGDITKRVESGVERVNQGVSLRFYKGTEIESLESEYFVLAQIIPERMTSSSSSNFKIYRVINNPIRYAYIDMDDIITDDKITLRDWINDKLGKLNKITYYGNDFTDLSSPSDYEYKKVEAKVNDGPMYVPEPGMQIDPFVKDVGGQLEVTKYRLILEKPTPSSKPVPRYNSKGEVVVAPYAWNDISSPYYGYDRSYIVDMIHRRSHVSSTSNLAYYQSSGRPDMEGYHELDYDEEVYNMSVAHLVDERDDGNGQHEMYPEDYYVGNVEKHPVVDPTIIKNENGTSRLVARADHNHGLRYIFSSLAITDNDYIQEVGTSLKIDGPQLVLGQYDKGIYRPISFSHSRKGIVIGNGSSGSELTTFSVDAETGDIYANGSLVVNNTIMSDNISAGIVEFSDTLQSREGTIRLGQYDQGIYVGPHLTPGSIVPVPGGFDENAIGIVVGNGEMANHSTAFSVNTETGDVYVGRYLKSKAIISDELTSDNLRFTEKLSSDEGVIVLGQYSNDPVSGDVFIVGNGTDSDHPISVLRITNEGNIFSGGRIVSGSSITTVDSHVSGKASFAKNTVYFGYTQPEAIDPVKLYVCSSAPSEVTTEYTTVVGLGWDGFVHIYENGSWTTPSISSLNVNNASVSGQLLVNNIASSGTNKVNGSLDIKGHKISFGINPPDSEYPVDLYVKPVAPTGTIANGSIGIGWDGLVHTYENGSWVSPKVGVIEIGTRNAGIYDYENDRFFTSPLKGIILGKGHDGHEGSSAVGITSFSVSTSSGDIYTQGNIITKSLLIGSGRGVNTGNNYASISDDGLFTGKGATITNDYILFAAGSANARRLYISSQEPQGSDIPAGSVGFGWSGSAGTDFRTVRYFDGSNWLPN